MVKQELFDLKVTKVMQALCSTGYSHNSFYCIRIVNIKLSRIIYFTIISNSGQLHIDLCSKSISKQLIDF